MIDAANTRETDSHFSDWLTLSQHKPFTLTPVQHACLTGRISDQILGGVGHHLYQEFDGTGLNAPALNHAITTLIQRHPMLVITFRDDGQQQLQLQPDANWNGLKIHNFRTTQPAEYETHLATMRKQNSHRLLAVGQGENFDLQLTLLPDNRHRLHANFDLLALDLSSISLVLDELARLLRGENLPATDPDYDFCSYLAHTAQLNATIQQQSRQYWLERMSTLAEAPQLPLLCEPEQLKQHTTTRRETVLGADDWAQLKQTATAQGISPDILLATGFSTILSRWSGQPRLLLSLALSQRQPVHTAVDTLVGNFSNLLLVDMAGDGDSFRHLLQANQQAFTQAYSHQYWSGIDLLRELRKTPGACPHGAPVVFTSHLKQPFFSPHSSQTLGVPGWGLSQTPQAWINHQAYEHEGSLHLQWDCLDALFPTGLLDAMFQAYSELIQHLLIQPQHWQQPVPDLIPDTQYAVRQQINAYGDTPAPEGLLYQAFWQRAQAQPNAVALIHGQQQLTYHELALQAQCCAGALVARGMQPGDRVAISMSKSIGQIVAALGILYAGGVYVPVSLDQPLERRHSIYQGAGTTLVLVSNHDANTDVTLADIEFLAWQTAISHSALPTPRIVEATEPAYIIYTSGSTGMPKGVIISHRGAQNTCAELNRRYAVTAKDRVLALSALHFDLSVYDIFGLLSAGGAIVLVDEDQRRDPAAWSDAIEHHQVSLWNTVPALFDMLLTYSAAFNRPTPTAIRAVMLSGDWIGLDLPERYHQFRPDGQFIAMGGATEASIWSNVYDVDRVSAEWRSIPYGYPLARQSYRVADEQGRDCPDWVPGELWIGGEGVALGYFNDPQRSAQQFVTHQGERWYRTGDMGCYWPDGRLEFLGRRDKQVKIGGYRIELGEIETALLRIDGVKSAVAQAVGERDKLLATFVVTQGTALCSTLAAEPGIPADYRTLIPAAAATATGTGTGTGTAINNLATTVKNLAHALGRPVRLHQAGLSDSQTARQLLQQLVPSDAAYTGWTASADPVLQARLDLQGYPQATVQHWQPELPPEHHHQADLVWVTHTQHTLDEPTLQAVLAQAASTALVCLHHQQPDIPAQSNLQYLASDQTEGQHWTYLQAPTEVYRPDSEKLAAQLHQLLPGYMVPQRLIFLTAFPLTANGKIDYRALAALCGKRRRRAGPRRELPQGSTEQALATQWSQLLNITELYQDSDFFQLGGNSLLATRLIGTLSQNGYTAHLNDLFATPSLKAFAATLTVAEQACQADIQEAHA